MASLTITAAATPTPSPTTTFTLMTYNLWKSKGKPTSWKERRPILLRQLQKLDPDVMLVQELCPEIHNCVAEALPNHSFVTDTDVPGWSCEGNIYYRSSMFAEVEHGAEDIAQEEEHRRLFWLRLCLVNGEEEEGKEKEKEKKDGGRTVLFSTAHYTWQGHPKECESDVNLRKNQARNTVRALESVTAAVATPTSVNKDQGGEEEEEEEEEEGRRKECIFFGGDLNESFWPKRIMESAGFIDCFSSLGLPCVPTHPNRSSLAHEEINADSTLDWLFHRSCSSSESESESESIDTKKSGPTVRPLLASVIKNMCGLSSDDPHERNKLAIVPSDHCPVLSVYRITW